MTSQTRQGSGHDWDDAKKAALFADIVSLKLSIDEAAALHGLRVDVIQEWLRLFRRSALVAFDERLKKTLIDQGANADALTAAEFTGHVEDVSIADLVQTIEIAGKDAVITVTHEGTDSRMWCSAGAIIDAESGRLTGEPAVYRILAFEHGRMVADLRPEQRTRTIYAATHRLLLEAARRKDESKRLELELGNINRFYRLGERSTSSRVRVSTDELSILRLFDGPRRLRDVLAQSHLGDLESLTALVRLVEDGYLVENDAAPSPARSHARGTPRSSPRPLVKTERLDPAQRSEPHSRAASAKRSESPRSDPAARADAREPARGRVPHSARERGDARGGGGAREHGEPRSRAEARTRCEAAARSEASTLPPLSKRGNASAASEAGEVTNSATSVAPMSVPRRADRTTPRWVFATMASAVLVPAAFWLGEAMSDLRATRRAPASASSVESHTAALDVAPTFSVSTEVHPPSAEIWLDRHPVATRELRIVLPRDGSTHELRVAAPGYIPVTLLFADVPPPRQISLEPLPATLDAPSAAAPATTAELPAAPEVRMIDEDAPKVRVIE